MNLFLYMLAAMAVQYGTVKVNGQSYVITSSCSGIVTEGSSCVLTCETGDVTETHIVWRRGANPPYQVARATCTTSIPSVPSDYVLACPGTSFTLNITAASVTRDKTTWKCDALFGGKESNETDLDVQERDTTTRSQTTGEMASSTSTSTTSPVSSTTDTHKTSTLSPVWIVIIIVFTAVVILVIVIIIVCCASMRKKKLEKTVKSEDKDIPLKNSC